MTPRDIATRLNLRRVRSTEWRGTCPLCNYAGSVVLTDSAGKALLWCGSCDDRAGFSSILREMGDGGDFHRAEPPPSAPRHASDTSEATAAALRWWDRAVPARGTIVAHYLIEARGIPHGIALTACDRLRFVVDCPHPSAGRLPAMLAPVVRPETGEMVAVHRTFLASDGSGKARVEPQRASKGPIHGGVVPLFPLDDEPLLIAEGIETALAACELLSLPPWAAISAGNLERLILPASVRDVVIAADRDPHGVGEHAAEVAAARWRHEGRKVRIAIPDTPGDFNDVLLARKRREGGHAA